MLGDVIGSSDKKGVQSTLHQAVDSVNRLKDSSVLAPFEITRGDEVALVLDKTAMWLDPILKFIYAAVPLKTRWVVVYGDISEGLESGSSAEMIGPGFVRADSTMKTLKKEGLTFYCETNSKLSEEISGIINLFLTALNDLTPFQLQALRHYKEGKTQTEVASELDKTQQQVQQTLQAINWKKFDRAESAIRSYLERIQKDTFKKEDR